MVPRGITVIAGGKVSPGAKTFRLTAERGSTSHGILSSTFLEREFKTVRYELDVTIHDERTFSYSEDTQLYIKGSTELFHHRDQNTLTRVEI